MQVRAVLFDLDGTLLDTLADIADAANGVLRSRGFPEHPPEAFRAFIGEGVAVLFLRALPPDRVSDELVARCVEEFRAAYAKNWNVQTRPYEGIPALLDALTRRGLALAMLSNKPDEFTQLYADAYLARWPFPAVFGSREGVPRKPDPAGAGGRARPERPGRAVPLRRRLGGGHGDGPSGRDAPGRRSLGVPPGRGTLVRRGRGRHRTPGRAAGDPGREEIRRSAPEKPRETSRHEGRGFGASSPRLSITNVSANADGAPRCGLGSHLAGLNPMRWSETGLRGLGTGSLDVGVMLLRFSVRLP